MQRGRTAAPVAFLPMRLQCWQHALRACCRGQWQPRPVCTQPGAGAGHCPHTGALHRRAAAPPTSFSSLCCRNSFRMSTSGRIMGHELVNSRTSSAACGRRCGGGGSTWCQVLRQVLVNCGSLPACVCARTPCLGSAGAQGRARPHLGPVGHVKGHVKGQAAVLDGLKLDDGHARLANDLRGAHASWAGPAAAARPTLLLVLQVPALCAPRWCGTALWPGT